MKQVAPSSVRRSGGIGPWLAGLSAASALIHASVVQEHLEEFLLYGVAFAAMSLFQGGWAFAMLGWGASRRMLTAGAIVNAGIVALWVLSRTTGLAIGPEPGAPEAVGAIDVLATVYEVALVAGCVAVLLHTPLRPIAPRALRAVLTAASACGLTLLTILAIAAGHGAGDGHDGQVLLVSAGVIVFGAWAVLDVRANGRPRFSWRLRADEVPRPGPEQVPAG